MISETNWVKNWTRKITNQSNHAKSRNSLACLTVETFSKKLHELLLKHNYQVITYQSNQKCKKLPKSRKCKSVLTSNFLPLVFVVFLVAEFLLFFHAFLCGYAVNTTIYLKVEKNIIFYIINCKRHSATAMYCS